MVGKGNFVIFESSNISETGQAMPTKLVCMHVTSTPTCMNFLSLFFINYSLVLGRLQLFFFCVGVTTFSTAHARGAWFKKGGAYKNLKR